MRPLRLLTALLTALAMATILLPAPASAAPTELTIDNARSQDLLSYSRVRVDGSLTCEQPTGQLTLLVSGAQDMGLAAALDLVPVDCAAGPVWWTSLLRSPRFHRGEITINVSIFDSADEARATGVFYL